MEYVGPWFSTTAPTKLLPSESLAILRQAIFGPGVRRFHSGGIFAAVSEPTPELVIQGMQAAKTPGAVVSFDLNSS
jgi:hypothetical protein